MGSPGPDLGRRSTDRQPANSFNLEAIAAKSTVGAPLVYRMLSSVGGVASTAILAIGGFAWSEVRDEWRELKSSIAEIRKEIDRQPTPEEFEKLQDKVDQVNDRLIRLEAKMNQ